VGDSEFHAAGSETATAPLITVTGMTTGRPQTAGASGFVETVLPAPVQRIGATVTFPDHGDGTAVLIAWRSSLWEAFNHGESSPAAGIRLVVTPSQWRLGLWDAAAGQEVVLLSGAAQFPRGIPQSFEVTRVGAAMTVHLPDGSERTITDPRVQRWTGDAACWQLYLPHPDDPPVVYTSAWAA
jgi:hypothetical protein